MSTIRERGLWKWIELTLLFGVLPLVIWWARVDWPRVVNPLLIPALLVGCVAVMIALLRDRGFQRRQLWNASGLWRAMPTTLAIVPLPAALLASGVALWRPELWLSFPRERPTVYVAVMILYPLLSVYPQEVIWRTYFFHRYQSMLDGVDPGGRAGRTPVWTVFLSGVAFGWMHCLFNNWVAVALTIPGGWLFAYTYARTRSTAAVWLEHAIWGCLIFTIGLGRYFYGGSSG